MALGADYTYDDEDLLTMQVINARTNLATDEPGFGERSFINLGSYLQWMWNPWRKLIFTLGSRVDHNTAVACDGGSWGCLGQLDDQRVSSGQATSAASDVLVTDRGVVQLSNRAAVVYAFSELKAYAKLIYGTSYKPPSPFQLYHRELTLSGSSVGNPALKPQTAQTVEATVGATLVPHLKTAVVGFMTTIDDMVIFLKQGELLEGRNANLMVAGLEANIGYESDLVSPFLNSSFIFRNRLTPQQRSDETELTWQYSPLNGTVANGRYPDWMLKGGVDVRPPELPLNVNLLLSLIGPRRATLVNRQLYNYLDLSRTYTLPAYLAGWLTVSTVGLRPFEHWGADETVLSLSGRYIPGGAVEPGYGGIDIPSLGPSVFLRVEQKL